MGFLLRDEYQIGVGRLGVGGTRIDPDHTVKLRMFGLAPGWRVVISSGTLAMESWVGEWKLGGNLSLSRWRKLGILVATTRLALEFFPRVK